MYNRNADKNNGKVDMNNGKVDQNNGKVDWNNENVLFLPTTSKCVVHSDTPPFLSVAVYVRKCQPSLKSPPDLYRLGL